ncbi:MAG: hypothetical protein M3680_11180 [Myxococcota bacterium]|nr:hypothetical protein [Myxococcota bacterium]
MKTWTVTCALCLTAGTVVAQPVTPTDPMVDPAPPVEPPPPPPPPPAEPRTVVVRPAAPMTQPIDDDRPTGFSIGVGFGYSLPTSLETPNVTSVRFRLPSGLTFEPLITLTTASNETDVGATSTDTESEIEIGALVRVPLRMRGRVDLEVLGAFAVRNVSSEPEADNMDRTATVVAASYGLAVTSWITSHWQVSLSALNPVFATVKTSQEMGPGAEVVNTQTKFGLVWDPSVIFMVHLYH